MNKKLLVLRIFILTLAFIAAMKMRSHLNEKGIESTAIGQMFMGEQVPAKNWNWCNKNFYDVTWRSGEESYSSQILQLKKKAEFAAWLKKHCPIALSPDQKQKKEASSLFNSQFRIRYEDGTEILLLAQPYEKRLMWDKEAYYSPQFFRAMSDLEKLHRSL